MSATSSPTVANAPHFAQPLARVARLLAQHKTDRVRLVAHAPEAECVAKDKPHKRYEFGARVSVAVTSRGGLVLGMLALSGHPYDGHTLASALAQVERLSGSLVERAYLDRGIAGTAGILDACSSQARAAASQQRSVAELRRRMVVEPVIGHEDRWPD